MWNVLFTGDCEKQIKKHIADGLIDEDDKRIISIWIKQVKKHGPNSLREGKSIWYDHDLTGKWNGYRASAYSYSGRIIYKIENKKIVVKVVRITPDHDYKR